MKHSQKTLALFHQEAFSIATASKDPSTKVGAVLIGHGKTILLKTYNGPASGVADEPRIFERPTKYLYACHAEQNLVSFSARYGIRCEGMDVFVTHRPCDRCCNSLVQAGIKTIMYASGTSFVSDSPETEEAVHDILSQTGTELVEVFSDGTHTMIVS